MAEVLQIRRKTLFNQSIINFDSQKRYKQSLVNKF